MQWGIQLYYTRDEENVFHDVQKTVFGKTEDATDYLALYIVFAVFDFSHSKSTFHFEIKCENTSC